MTTDLEKFQMRKKRRDEPDRAKQAAEAGALTAGGLAARHSILHTMLDRAEDAAVRPTRAWDDFTQKLQTGDVLFHRRPTKVSAYFEPGNAINEVMGRTIDPDGTKIPLTEKDVMLAAKGDPHYHASVYMGRGKIGDAYDRNAGIRKNTPLLPEVAEDIKVYRPRVKDAERKAALDYIRSMHGAEYKGFGGQLEHGLKHLLSPLGGPATTRKKCASGVCTEVAANAYPSVFHDQFMSPADMRHAKDMELVARYNPIGKVTAREKIMARGVYPLLRNLKWGVLGGLGAYGAMSLSDHFRKHATKGPSDGNAG